MKTLAQLKRLKKADLKKYAVENFDIEMAELEGLTNPQIISEIQDAEKDKAAELENAKLDAEEAMIDKILEPVDEDKSSNPCCFGNYKEDPRGLVRSVCLACLASDECKKSSKVGPCKGCPHSDLAFKEGASCCAPNAILENCNEHNNFKYKTLAYPQEPTTVTKNEENAMPETVELTETPEVPEMKENFIIRANDCRLQMGPLKKAKEAVPAVAAVNGTPAEKDEDGNIIKKATKAIPAKEAKPATPAIQKVYLIANDDSIMDEIIARMADQNFYPLDMQREYVDGDKPRICYTAETAAPIRAALKAVKAKTGYNAPGLAIEAEEKKAEAKKKAEEEKAKKAAEKEEKAETEPETFDDVETEKTTEEGMEDWPGEDFVA